MRTASFILSFFLFFITSPSFSEEIEDRQLDEELKWLKAESFDAEVITASRKAQKISEAPATIISITQEEIEARGWRDLKDIFKALPGIDVSYNVQGEIKSLVTMRGVAGNQKILILQDGRRYSPASGERFLYGCNVPLNVYRRIEIVFGPASCMYGADAYAGVINLITKDGSDYDGTQVNLGYLSSGIYSGDATFGKKINNDSDVLISARVTHGEGEKLHEDYDEYKAVHSYQGKLAGYENDYPVKNWNLLFKLHYKKFTAGFDWQHELESNAGVSLPSVYAYIEDFVWGQDIRHFYITHDSYADKSLNIRTTIEAGDYEVNPSSNFIVVSKDAEGNLTDKTTSYKYAYSSYLKGGIQADWNISDRLSTIAGISYEKVASFPKTRNLNSPFDSDGKREVDMSDFTDAEGYTFGIQGFAEPVFGERNFNNFGVFFHAEYKISDALKLDGGIRYDYNEIYGETLNPRFGMLINPLENLTVKLLYGTAYIQPANFFRYENFANPFILHIPNEDIQPEELENYSLDISYRLGQYFDIHGAAFLNKMKNIIRPVEAPAQADGYVYCNPYATAGDYYVEYNGNQGEIESKGGELTLRHKTERFLNSLSYSYLTGDDGGFDIPQVSEHKITLNSSYTGEKWTFGLTLRYYSDVSTDKNNYRYGLSENGGDESYCFDGAFVTYLNAIYKFNKSLSANLSIDNLFDTKHYGGVPFDGSPVVASRTPQPLRTFYLGLRYSF